MNPFDDANDVLIVFWVARHNSNAPKKSKIGYVDGFSGFYSR
jgi:hypothetical protein